MPVRGWGEFRWSKTMHEAIIIPSISQEDVFDLFSNGSLPKLPILVQLKSLKLF